MSTAPFFVVVFRLRHQEFLSTEIMVTRNHSFSLDERVDKKKRNCFQISFLLLLVVGNFVFSQHFVRKTFSSNGGLVEESSLEVEGPSPISIFYNVYVPKSSPGRSFEIVREQLGQFDMSDAARLSGNNLTVYYTTIEFVNATKRVQELCQERANLTCRHLEHFDKGFEEVTLQKLHEYCSLPEHENERVVYLHNKGSYHNNRDDWRRHGTLGAMHQDCVRPPDDTCNLCAIHVSYIPSVQQHGNMWSSKCSYVKRLLSPLEYRNAMLNSSVKYKALRRQVRMHHESWGASGPWGFAKDRHSNEHWIGSHPSVVPCDLNPFPYETFWKNNFNATTSNLLEWAMLPRRDLQDRDRQAIGDGPSDRFQTARDDVKGRLKDYFFLPGLLLRWLMVYQQVPDESSWSVYESFPDFEFWKNATEMHGTKVLDAVFGLSEPLVKVDRNSSRKGAGREHILP